jgi:hypothetical protein
MYSENREG